MSPHDHHHDYHLSDCSFNSIQHINEEHSHKHFQDSAIEHSHEKSENNEHLPFPHQHISEYNDYFRANTLKIISDNDLIVSKNLQTTVKLFPIKANTWFDSEKFKFKLYLLGNSLCLRAPPNFA
jgi:hypothetical protein